MLKIYKNSKFSTRLVALLTLTALTSYIAYTYGYDWLTIGLAVLSLGVILETFIVHTKFILTAIIAVINLVITGFIAFVIYEIMQYDSSTEFLGFTNLIVLQLAGVVTTITVLVISYLFSQGRVWVNALNAFVIYNVVLVVLIVNTVEALNFAYAAGIAFIASLVYVILRAFIPFRVKHEYSLKDLPKSSATTAAVKRIQKSYLDLTVKPYGNYSTLAYNKERVFLITPVAVKKTFDITRKEILVDDVDITGALETILVDSQALSHSQKINQRLITPVLFITNSKTSKHKLAGIKVRKRNQPDRVLGTVFIVSDNGLDKLFALNHKTKLDNKTLTVLNNL